MGEGLLINKASRSHSNTLLPEGLLSTSDQPHAETSTWQQTLTKDIHAPGGIRTRNLSKRAAAHLRLTPRGHEDKPFIFKVPHN